MVILKFIILASKSTTATPRGYQVTNEESPHTQGSEQVNTIIETAEKSNQNPSYPKYQISNRQSRGKVKPRVLKCTRRKVKKIEPKTAHKVRSTKGEAKWIRAKIARNIRLPAHSPMNHRVTNTPRATTNRALRDIIHIPG